MKVLKTVVIAIVATLVVLAVIGLLLPGHVHVERNTMIDAAPEQIYQYVGTLRHWKDWTAWNPRKYPGMEWSYAGPESGVGAESTWDDDETGKGHLKITKADPQTGIEYDLTFEGEAPFPAGSGLLPKAKGRKSPGRSMPRWVGTRSAGTSAFSFWMAGSERISRKGWPA